MQRPARTILVQALIAALLLAACGRPIEPRGNTTGIPGTDQPASRYSEEENMQGIGTLPTPMGDAVPSNGGGQGITGDASPDEPVSTTPGQDPLGEAERNTILDQVNQAPPVLAPSSGGSPSAPGTESQPSPNTSSPAQLISPQTPSGGQGSLAPSGPPEPVSTTVPQNVPGEAERNAILDQVNQAPPVLAPSSGSSSGSSGTESQPGVPPGGTERP
jgi:hypothetical protein